MTDLDRHEAIYFQRGKIEFRNNDREKIIIFLADEANYSDVRKNQRIIENSADNLRKKLYKLKCLWSADKCGRI